MKFYVDSADLDGIREIAEYFPIDGFTTNPKILSAQAGKSCQLMAACRELVFERGWDVFVQAVGKNSDEMVMEAERLSDYFGGRLVVKLPAVEAGYKALPVLKAKGLRVCVTVVHSVLQAVAAAKAGADFVAPYISHIDEIGADGIKSASEMIGVIEGNGYACQVLGASFRTSDQVRRICAAGCPAVTIAPQLYPSLIAHPSTDESMRIFSELWNEAYGERLACDLIPQ